jgi:hypothetical protein
MLGVVAGIWAGAYWFDGCGCVVDGLVGSVEVFEDGSSQFLWPSPKLNPATLTVTVAMTQVLGWFQVSVCVVRRLPPRNGGRDVTPVGDAVVYSFEFCLCMVSQLRFVYYSLDRQWVCVYIVKH